MADPSASASEKLLYRLSLMGLKCRRRIPQFSWLDISRMLASSSDAWPTERLAIPVGSKGDTVLYDTPIGLIGSDAQAARIVGLMVIDQLRRVYERGPVVVRKGDVVIDLGANIGSFTRYALTRGASKVIAFEPEPQNTAFLEQTFASEIASGRVHLVRAAAWHERTTLRFEPAGMCSQVSDGGCLEIPAVTIDEAVSALPVSRVDFIKADIEGAERHALAGAKQTIAQFKPRMALCIYHLPDDPQVIPQIVNNTERYRFAFNLGRTQAFFSPA